MHLSALRASCLRALCVATLLAACAPVLDWREVRPADSGGLVLLMPCRAAAQKREVVLAGQTLRLALNACDAGERTWAVASADVADPALVPAALRAMHAAAAANIGAAAPDWLPLSVPGATPQPAAGRARLAGRRPDGKALIVDTAVFSRGTVVVQVSLLGDAPTAGDAQMLFESLRFEP